jgi:hypothetical protein
MNKQSTFDNAVPADSDCYPMFRPAQFMGDMNLIVEVGEYLVDRDGRIFIATTSNAGPYQNDYIRDINEPFLRGRYLGNTGDSVRYANQIRRATASEIEEAKRYVPSGQLKLL